MSQIYKTIGGGGGGGNVPTSFVTDVNSPSVPIANVENVLGGTTVSNNANGIQTDGSSGSNTLTIQLTNRQNGSVTTTDATPTTLISFAAAASAAVYNVQCRVAAFDATDVAGAAYHVDCGFRTDGATVTVFPDADFVDNEEAAMTSTDINVTSSGNNFILQITGIAGKTIRWSGSLTYLQVV